VATLVAALGAAVAQPRAELTLGVAGAPVAGAWNPVRAVVRDAPGAVLRLEIDAGGFELGEIPQRVEARVANAGGVQRLDLDLPLPSWRRLAWRIEQGGRVLASGALGARERDERPLTVIVSTHALAWADALGADARPVPAAAADLPSRAAGWDGVDTLLIDGSAAAPEPAVVVTAAAAGVRVLLPRSAPAGYAPLVALLAEGRRAVGAGSIEGVPGEPGTPLPPPQAAWSRPLRGDVVAAAAAALPAPGWRHLPRLWVLAGVGAFAALIWTLLHVGGAAGIASAATVLVGASLAVPLAAPSDAAPREEGAVVLTSGGGLGLRVPLTAVARLPRGESSLQGRWAPRDARPLRWEGDVTLLPLSAGGRARLAGAPEVVTVPDDVLEAPAAATSELPVELRDVLPSDVTAVRSGTTWWLSRRPAAQVAAVRR
jgi:hypothetical protein